MVDVYTHHNQGTVLSRAPCPVMPSLTADHKIPLITRFLSFLEKRVSVPILSKSAQLPARETRDIKWLMNFVELLTACVV